MKLLRQLDLHVFKLELVLSHRLLGVYSSIHWFPLLGMVQYCIIDDSGIPSSRVVLGPRFP